MADRHRFGQSPPPLVEYLQDILNRYPDGGQILKELIQNAEDAEASEVRFLYDRAQYGAQTLHSPKLAPYQGPALCAYNDTCFTEDDWNNIQNTARSVKKGDPMKIGRFGLGFNSVYHLTDLPMILSGQHVAILDPHESIFRIDGLRQSGRIWHLKEDAEEIKSLQDQFSPFKKLFDSTEDPFETGSFNGTIFRFPLRQTPSRLSKTLYDYQKVVDLFDSFKADGDIVLLFMHHVRSIKLMTRETTGHSATDYRVSMSSKSKQEKENRFTTKVREARGVSWEDRETVVSTCRFSMAIDGGPTRDWLVTNYVKGRGISEEAMKLSEELSLLPWVGVAMPLSEEEEFAGRTFCCLPLPARHESTGLPVHVHGFFGVSDNRRSLKWTGTDQKSDSAARWNELLVQEILPAAYARLITDATKCCTQDTLYAALPDRSHAAPEWDKALTPFFDDALTQKVVWTPTDGGKWIAPDDAVFNRTSVPTAVLDYLVGAGIDVVTLPKHVMQAIDDTFDRQSLKEVTPGLLRATLKKTEVHNSSREHKLTWLQYALDDGKYDEMEGIELLPLADKTFTTFNNNKTIFIESEEHPRALLPGLEGRFLDMDTDNQDILLHMRAAATEAEEKARSSHPCLQLRHLSPQLVATHLREALPPDWLQVSHVTWDPARAQQPPEEWLAQLWRYLQVHFPNDLSPFVGLPLLPTVGMNVTSLVRLEQPSKVMRPRYDETNIPDVIKKLTRDVDATVLEDVPPYLNHPKLEEFIHRCTPSGLLGLFLVVGTDKVIPQVNALSPETKKILRAFFAKCDNLLDTGRELLTKLPIFEAVDDTTLKSRYLPALDPEGKMRRIAPDLSADPLPEGLFFPTTLIVTKDLESQTLGHLVRLQQLSTAQLLTEMVEKVRCEDYTREQTDSLMLWILKNLHTLKTKDPGIIDRIQTLAFVTTNNNSKVTPAELFSPEEAVSDVLLGEPVFPAPPYTDKITLTALLLLGMRQKLSAQDILHAAESVQTFYASDVLTLSDAKRKAVAIISVLLHDHEMLTTRVKGALLTAALMGVNFLPVCSERPRSYLPGLSWYPEANSATIFVSPKDARYLQCAELVGATMPIVDGEISDGIISAFGWDKNKLPIEKVVGQLKMVCDHYDGSKRPAKHHFVQILTQIYQHIDARLSAGDKTAMQLLSSDDFPPWVWQGDGLAAPKTVALTSPFNLILDLAPYRFILPEEFRDFKQMFKDAGVKESFDKSDLVQTLHEIQSAPKMSVERDLKLSVDIIGWLVSHPDILEEVRDDILVPIATKDSSRLTLAPVSECTYNDVSWSDAQDILDDEDEEFKPLHKLITLDAAQLLEAPSLSQRVVNAEEFGFDQCGQHEKVTQRLKNILNDYPEGAGIFKELVQNADDAGATEVKFLVDWRTNKDSKENLIDQGMAVCHGPALWAFNNAAFSEEDFKNIQNLGGQTKLEALEKVGRFGVGFNSVYHLTDVPSFVSGSRVLFFDPHATHLSKHIKDKSRPGIGLDLKKNIRLTGRCKDQFKPFQGVFGYSTNTSYNGTLFRLPLRTPQEASESEISDVVYSKPGNANMERLIESFKEGLKPLLLFTQNVRHVTMYTLDEFSDPSSMIETFHVSKSPVKHLREMQSPLHSNRLKDKFQIQSNCLLATSGVMKLNRQETDKAAEHPVTSMVVKVTCRQGKDNAMSDDWIISFCMGTGTSLKLALSESGRKAGLVPCGGVAALLKSGDDSHQDAFIDNPLNGEVFCFLPLSVRTGLPVHVNGSFAVASNRRGLWEETSTDRNDLKVEWNKALMEDAVCKAYARLITDATKCCTKDTLYAMLPDRNHTDPDWDKALTPFLDEVLAQKVVWTHANDGKWITPKDAVFNRTSVPTAVLDYLVGARIDVVTLPKHVMQAIDDTFDRQSLKEVTPGLLRATLKKTGVHKNSREHKLTWLQYALDDGKYDEMEGIELLPLADKTFTTFNNNKTIFIESEEHPRALLPGLEGRFLDMDTDNQDILLHMRAAATEAEEKARSSYPCLQLRHLSPQLVATHLREALPPDWLQVSHVTWDPTREQQPPEEWLAQLWRYLQAHFPNDLSPFVGLPLLPIVGMNASSLVRLEQPSKVMRPRYDETNIPDVIKKLARDVDATVLEDVPLYLKHPKLDEFIHRCTPSGLLGLFLVVGTDKVIPQVNALNPETKKILRAFFAKCDNLLDTGRELLTKLPIFEAVDDTTLKPRYLAALDPEGKMRRIAPDLSADPLPEGLFFPTTLIVTKDLESQTLGHLVRLQQLSTAQLLTEMVEKVRCEDYTREQTDSLMLWILKNLHTLKAKDPGIIDRIQTLAFVTTNNNSKVTPAELFSPEEAVSDVLLGEPVFPGPPYTDKITLTALLELGMRQKLSAQDILHAAESVQTFNASDVLTLSDAKRKAVAIISVLLHDHEMLTTRVKGALLTAALMDVNFLPVCFERPRSYLPGLSWYPEANSAAIFVSPKDARYLQCAELVGATMPIVNGEMSDGFISAFGWDKDKLPIDKVVGQLKMVCVHSEGSKRPAKHHFVQILTEIYQHVDARLSAGDTTAMQLLSSDDFPPWVWQGDYLAAPKTVALTSPFNLILDLAPYRFILPEEFRDFRQMFKDAGVKESFDKSDLVQTLHEIQSAPKMSVERDLKLSVDIIGWLVSHQDILEEVRDDILVPIATKDSSRLTLAPVSECTYNDVSWGDAQDILDDEDEEFKPLHKLITLDVAQLLEVPSLSQRVVNAEEFGFDQCGQHEKVTQRLKNILNDYPEGAGIFKELVQNADDAGATEVKFLVDWRTNEVSKENLIDQGMAVCHGPALWAFNNAAFSEEDFMNIQNLGGQTKLEALEKVGRFGVGFNSVYHLTDVPSFVSGSRVLFFDPHATHLSKHIKDKSRPGIGLDLKKNTRLTGRCKDQFKPFQGVFGYSTNTSYNGTLFRLPLRTPQEASESEISDVVYSKPGNANMERLIESFKEGLKPLLLFTQNVRHVAMYTLDQFSDPSSMVETFDVSKSPVKYLREMQSPLHSNRLTDKFQIQSNCLLATSGVMKLNRQGTDKAAEHPETSMVVKVTCRQGKDNAMSEEWIISSCMGTETSLKLALSESGRKAGLVPCGGVAALLKSCDDNHQNAFIDNPLNGEVFCFLPLSVRTGLPVHVNGSFAVASNRRGLWEETSTDRNDLKVEWNKALMEDAVCKAYALLITDATKCCTKDTLYAMLPDRNHTDPDWDKALTPFLDEVLAQKVVWTPANDGKWITPKDAVFNRTSVPTAVLDYLVGAGIDVVTLPKHVMQAIDDTFDRQSLKEVTPGLLRATLKKTGVHNSSREHKLTWLQYALDDGKYDEMEGIELLPLADKTFTTFNNNKTIFIESEEHPRALLPGLEGRFLDMDTDIQPTLHHIRAAATEAEEKARSSHPCLQLRHLSPQLVATHLREALPLDWLQVSHVTWDPALAQQPPEEWLAQLWRYLQVHFPNDLSPFVGLPLLPIVGMNATSLVRLEQPSKVMRPRYDETNIPDVIKKLARDVDATVLEDVPLYLKHPKLDEFIHRCTPSGLLGLFLVVGTDKVIPQVNALNPETKKILRAFFAKCDNLLDTGRELLTKLPIFEAVDDTTLKPRYLAALDPEGKMRRIAPDLSADPLPEGLFFPTTLIVTKDLESQTLGHLVRLQQLSTAQLLSEMVEKVRCEDYTREQTDSLMLWILKNLHTLKAKDPGIIDRIQTLAFVTTNNNSKVTPAELFSPEEAVSDVLLGEPVFPGPPYTDKITLTALLELGMRQKLSAQDILHAAESVQTFNASDVLTLSDAKRKAVAIISVLLHDHEMLTTRVKGALLTAALMDVNFLPVCFERPRSYLPGLSWNPEANSAAIFVSPKDARYLQCAELVGATMPIVNGEMSDGFISAFGWDKDKLPIDKVVGQLKMVCVHSEGSKRPAKHHFVQILTEIYQHVDARLSAGDTTAMQLLSSDDFPPWVWQGDYLAAPKTVALTSPFNLILDLAPYRFILPEEFRDFRQMFKDAGVKESFDKSDLVQTLHEIQSAPKMSVERDLKLSVDIIGWLVSHQDILEEVRDDILVPIATKDSSRLTLAPVSECTYNDVSWGDAQDILDDEDEEFKPLHKLITLDVAQLLEVPSLSQRVVNAEEFGFDQCGQHEKVTQRLKNILNDYPEGAGIFKELVQNADDAGATEVKFLVDWRTNEVSKENLIDQGMAVCHGPALWAFNNAAFSEEDFMNIQNLGGQTKLEALEKVGRFGVGFNSVYHLTDVPSFVSGSRVLFFDPHATHLSKHIKDKSRPGIGLDLKKNTRLTGRCKDQFKPFQGVFGYSTNTSYNGTLFRLPLRTPQEASESEISDVVYSKPGNANMERLIESFKEGLKPLLLFTQNVRHVAMYTLDQFSDPSSMVETFDVSKSPVKYLREMQSPLHSNRLTDKFQIQSNCLLATSGVMKLNRQGTDKAAEHPETSMVVKVTCRQGKDNAMSEEWIISSCMGTGTSLKLALSESGRKAGLVPCGGVAALLKSGDDSHQDASIDNPLNGEVFCFLPLSVRTGLPVHVNGSFAVASNRRGLWEETSTDRNDLKVEWNKALMEDAVCKAYVTMLLDLSTMAKTGQLKPYQFHSFWPNPCPIPDTTHYSVLLKAFYSALSSDHKPPPLFEFEEQWLSFTSTVFLDPEIPFSSDENVAARRALQQCCSDNTVVELPEWGRQGFEEAGRGELLSKHTYTEERFYSELFFPRIHELSDEIRDPLMLRILSRETEDYHELIETIACIPVSPSGQELNFPGNLVHPNGKISAMFLPEDKKFPHGSTETYLKPSRLEVLTKLGMCKDEVPWEVVIERAESVVDLNTVNQTESRKRIVALLDFIVDKTKEERTKKQREKARKNLSIIPFLPIMQKPPEWPFEWRGSEYPTDALLSALDLQPSKNHDIAGVSNPILCSKIITGKGKHNNRYTVPVSLNRFLGLVDKSPDLSETLTNLMAIVAVDMKTLSKDELECTRTSYLKTCQHLQKFCHGSKENENDIATRLFKTPFIMSQVKKKFLLPSDVSFDLKFTCAPYLYQVPEELATELTPLFLACKVKTAFEACDFIRALDHLKEDKGNQILSSNEVNLAQDLLKAASDLKGENIKEHSLWIPDQDGVLRRPSEVCYNDCAWIEQKDDMVFCHKVISRDLAVDKLGVKPVRHKALEAYSHSLTCFGTDFGQVEKLTNRIKNLLDAYPFGKEILKELLQNADDAGATEIHFVYDKQQHGTKHIFDDSWKELQGPALCVYNNRPFTEEDLIGIQSLGEGSKTHDPVKTGKYGVGFNAVYHLTDCPSFMTGGDTLCVFDPQLRFVPGARLECPGRMYRGIDDYFRQQYKDVFDCYLKDNPAFWSPESTMFRFPLRTATLATDSDLSDEDVTEEVIMDLLGRFKSESFEVLLFLNSVEKIKISVIESDGTSHEFYHAEALISEKAKQDRRKFADCVAECAQSKKSLHVLPTHHVTYNLDLRDNSQHKETWIVHQRIGFEDKDIPNSIKEAHSAKELGLLPRGGAAVCHKDCKQPYKAKAFRESKRYEKCDHMGPKRAFCFLPLPIETKLPVHVNGHFALDHEARRNLWRDEKGGMKSDWNKTLINEVIAPAYVAVLDAKRAADFGVQQRSFSASKARDVRRSLDTYHNLFPSVSKTTDEWKGLSLAVYQYSDRKQIRLLPLLRSTVDDRKPHYDQPGNQRNLQMALEWLPPTGAGKEEAFFNTLKYEDAGSRESHKKPKRQVLIESLLGLGFNLLVSPTTILDDFQEAEVEVKEIKPESVIDFLQTYATDDPLCRIGASLPVQLSSTTFKEPENLQVVLHYCLSTRKRQEESKEHTSRGHSLPVPSEPKQEHEHALHGLPLLLTQDNILRAFDVSCPVFATDYAKLVPRVPGMFVHNLCVSELLHKKTDNSVRSFDIRALSELMPRVLDKLEYGNGKTVKLSPTAPPQDWICCIWQFLDREVHRMAREQEAGQKAAIDEVIGLFADWAILPAVTPKPTPKFQQQGISMYSSVATMQPGDRYLVPLCKAHTVVNFNNPYIQQDTVAEFLRKLHCLQLDTDCLRASSHFEQLPMPLVPLLTNHVGILRVLHFILVEQGGTTSLDTNEATELLKYFEDEAVKYTHEQAHLRMLRSLPLYKTIHNKLISLTAPSQCHVLPVGIPTADMDEWIKRSNAVFLEKNSKLEKLHKTLGCSGIKEADVYQRYIFPNIDHLSDDAVQVHLDYLRKMLYGAYTIEGHTRESLLGSLRDLRVIPSQRGRRPVGEFYDDTHDVFHEMVSDENFLPECYRKEMWKWRQFFIDIGLINKVTKVMFLEYAREVERLAKVTKSEESRLKEKSNVLVKHFFEIEKLSDSRYATSRVRGSFIFLPREKVVRSMTPGVNTPYKKDCRWSI
ncbi:sacsin-like [Branchiostoma lanceolatum]|uniref:sacsin-like n=1 Tax=Branchiostoma lanceolatum TaxID=7740 RepID=UPI003453770D